MSQGKKNNNDSDKQGKQGSKKGKSKANQGGQQGKPQQTTQPVAAVEKKPPKHVEQVAEIIKVMYPHDTSGGVTPGTRISQDPVINKPNLTSVLGLMGISAERRIANAFFYSRRVTGAETSQKAYYAISFKANPAANEEIIIPQVPLDGLAAITHDGPDLLLIYISAKPAAEFKPSRETSNGLIMMRSSQNNYVSANDLINSQSCFGVGNVFYRELTSNIRHLVNSPFSYFPGSFKDVANGTRFDSQTLFKLGEHMKGCGILSISQVFDHEGHVTQATYLFCLAIIATALAVFPDIRGVSNGVIRAMDAINTLDVGGSNPKPSFHIGTSLVGSTPDGSSSPAASSAPKNRFSLKDYQYGGDSDDDGQKRNKALEAMLRNKEFFLELMKTIVGEDGTVDAKDFYIMAIKDSDAKAYFDPSGNIPQQVEAFLRRLNE